MNKQLLAKQLEIAKERDLRNRAMEMYIRETKGQLLEVVLEKTLIAIAGLVAGSALTMVFSHGF